MGQKKRNKQGNPNAPKHATQNFGQLVSKAALVQLLPDIRTMIQELGSNIALQQANSLELLYIRLMVLEQASGLSQEELTERVTVIQDKLEGLEKVDDSKLGDTLRVELQVRDNKEGSNFNEPQRKKIDKVGTGQTLGPVIEGQLVGLKAGDTKEFPLGNDNSHIVKVTVNRVSRPLAGTQPEPVAAAPQADPNEINKGEGGPWTSDTEAKTDAPAGDDNVAQVQG